LAPFSSASVPHPQPPTPTPSKFQKIKGLYTELDFRNEALNASRMRQLLDESDSGAGAKVVIPAPLLALTTR
jgi:predicted unusual protein kinase regulating ubiquinone biosynthesis (AarF/ABC1/UbiB family)